MRARPIVSLKDLFTGRNYFMHLTSLHFPQIQQFRNNFQPFWNNQYIFEQLGSFDIHIQIKCRFKFEIVL